MKAEGPNVAQELRLPKRSPGFAATLTRSLALYLAVLFIGALALVYSQLLNTFITWPSIPNFLPSIGLSSSPRPAPSTFQMQADANITELQNLPSTPPMASNKDQSSSPTCPEYFRWIHEDLRPWRETGGVTREAVEKARSKAHFRLLVVDGRVYVKQYKKAFQTRDLFSIWGILQLLRRYPGQVPDLDLMFNCNDHPGVPKSDYNITIDPASPARPPPVFSYCADAATFDLVFPDWSFWGWPEVNAKPWKQLLKELTEGNKQTKWEDREPYAFWKGNPSVSPLRGLLLRHCNASEKQDWNARLFSLDWRREVSQGFTPGSNLAHQCKHRYKIYVEGRAWSVSEKYIMACDSPTLFITQRYHDFFSRGLVPMQHYWPIHAYKDMCRSIKFAVDWGNNHQKEAKAMGREGSNFVQEKLNLDYVYDYMFYLLNEYSKLLKYKPTVPSEAMEFSVESIVQDKKGLTKSFLINSMLEIQQPSEIQPCKLPPPFTNEEKKALLDKKVNLTRQVELLDQNVH